MAAQYVIFKIDDEEYGIEIMKVNVIEKYQEVVKMPNSPKYIEGVINLRGEVLPIFSLRKKFNLKEKPHDENTKIVVIYLDNIKVGFIVDSVREIIHIDESFIESTPQIVTGISGRYIKNIAKLDDRMIILLDVELILEDEEKLSLGKVVEGVPTTASK